MKTKLLKMILNFTIKDKKRMSLKEINTYEKEHTEIKDLMSRRFRKNGASMNE